MKIIGVSDVSIDYGSPEVPALFHDICVRAGVPGTLIEPDEHDRPPLTERPQRAFSLIRMDSDLPSQTAPWLREYLARAAAAVSRNTPDLLVIFGGAAFPILELLPHRPRYVVYHAYEQIAELGIDDIVCHQLHLGHVTTVITPNIDRLVYDCERLGTWPRSTVTLYNSADVSYPQPVVRRPPQDRNGRFLWTGALDRRRTLSHYLAAKDLEPFGIDIFGRITDPAPDTLLQSLKARPNVALHGLVAPDVLNAARADAAFSLIWWNPDDSAGHYHLASNRFFTSLAAGVPPVCAPHPQCVRITETYDCAVIAKDWSLEAIRDAMAEAADIAGSDKYAALVERCLAAADGALSWTAQSRRVVDALPMLGG